MSSAVIRIKFFFSKHWPIFSINVRVSSCLVFNICYTGGMAGGNDWRKYEQSK